MEMEVPQDGQGPQRESQSDTTKAPSTAQSKAVEDDGPSIEKEVPQNSQTESQPNTITASSTAQDKAVEDNGPAVEMHPHTILSPSTAPTTLGGGARAKVFRSPVPPMRSARQGIALLQGAQQKASPLSQKQEDEQSSLLDPAPDTELNPPSGSSEQEIQPKWTLLASKTLTDEEKRELYSPPLRPLRSRTREAKPSFKFGDWLNAETEVQNGESSSPQIGLSAPIAPLDVSSSPTRAKFARAFLPEGWFSNTEHGGKSKLDTWQRTQQSLLWIHGKAGSGKTVLTSAIIDKISNEVRQDKSIVLYFYFDARSTVEGLLESLISQSLLSLTQSSRFEPASNTSSPVEDLSTPFPERTGNYLQKFVYEVVLSNARDSFVFLDGLDECVEWPALFQFIQLLRRSPDLHILLSSRRNLDIEKDLKSLDTVDLSIEEVFPFSTIEKYVDRELEQDPRLQLLSSDLKIAIRERVLRGSSGMFRWVTLQLDELKKLPTPRAIRESLPRIPGSIVESYHRYLGNIGAEYQDLACCAFRWLVLAQGPLTLGALCEAIILNPTSDNLFNEEERLIEPTALPSILGLITYSDQGNKGNAPKDKQVVFWHSSMREYFVSDEIRQHAGASKFTVAEETDHQYIARCCLRYLLQYAESSRGAGSGPYPLLQYASLHWVSHLRLGEGQKDASLMEIVGKLFDSQPAFQRWLGIFDPEEASHQPGPGQALYYASNLGLVEIVRQLLDRGAEPCQTNSRGSLPLQIAISQKHYTTAEVLLRRGASTTAKDSTQRSALIEAVTLGDLDYMRLLLLYSRPEDLVRLDYQGRSLFHEAASCGQAQVFDFLLRSLEAEDNFALPWSPTQDIPHDHDYLTDLRAFAKERNVAAKSILGTEARDDDEQPKMPTNTTFDVNTPDTSHCTSMHLAARNGHTEMVKLLITVGANIDVVNDDKETPLHFSILYEQDEVRDLLMDRGADLTLQDKQNQTATQLAWKKKCLDWSAYREDQLRTLKISQGAQAKCDVLRKSKVCEGPERIFCKTYNFSPFKKSVLRDVQKCLLRENRLLQRLDHPFIVSYLGYEDIIEDIEGEKVSRAKLYLEYCEGGELETRHIKHAGISSAGPGCGSVDPDASKSSDDDDDDEEVDALTETEVWLLMHQLFSALAYLHYGAYKPRDAGPCEFQSNWEILIHRDIKPANVILTFPEGKRIAKLCDLGIATAFNRANQTKAVFRGTENYSPPELRDESTPERQRIWTTKGDNFALGKTIANIHKSFAMPARMADILDKVQSSDPRTRLNSLEVLAEIDKETGTSFQKLDPMYQGKTGGPTLQALWSISNFLDTDFPFSSGHAVRHRKKTLARMQQLLTDGANALFNRECVRSLHLAVLLEDFNLVCDLLFEGQNLDEKWTVSGWTPLHLAVQQGDIAMVTKLTASCASTSIKDRFGKIAADYMPEENSEEISKLLISPSPVCWSKSDSEILKHLI
ncbi:hypothetical protein IFR05_002247 [Cadophora sp. M221]|nr:hypothetical protein IFR05_002247 [Cadophora sp. M221]